MYSLFLNLSSSLSQFEVTLFKPFLLLYSSNRLDYFLIFSPLLQNKRTALLGALFLYPCIIHAVVFSILSSLSVLAVDIITRCRKHVFVNCRNIAPYAQTKRRGGRRKAYKEHNILHIHGRSQHSSLYLVVNPESRRLCVYYARS